MRALSFAAAAAFSIGLTGAALAASRTYDLPPFEEISVATGVIAVVAVGDDQSVEAEAASDAVLNDLRVEVRGTRLEIWIDRGPLGWLFSLGQTREVTVRVSVPALLAAEASSGAALDIAGMTGARITIGASSGASVDARDVDAGTLVLESSSGARVTAAGTCDSIMAEASSGARVEASTVACELAAPQASSGASIALQATQSVDARASSGGRVTIHGNPARRTVNASSGGSVNFTD